MIKDNILDSDLNASNTGMLFPLSFATWEISPIISIAPLFSSGFNTPLMSDELIYVITPS